MIFDFKRHHTNIQSWQELYGANCSLCNNPYRIIAKINDYEHEKVTCDSCGWNLQFYPDQFGCIRPYILTYNGFLFCLGQSRTHLIPNIAPFDVMYVKENTAVGVWEPFANHLTTISLRAIIEMIKSGEAKAVFTRINNARNRLAQAA